MQDVFVTRVSGFLPNDPISNEEMEDYLGYINGSPSRARNCVAVNRTKQRYIHEKVETSQPSADV